MNITHFPPFKNIKIELSRLETLYYSTLYAYEATADEILSNVKSRMTKATDRVTLAEKGFDNESVEVNILELHHRMQSQFPRHLREVIFVRLISALEVFIIESLRDIFLERRDLFHSQTPIEFTQGEILSSRSITSLWTKFINKELRNLQNQGLREKAKYFKAKIGVDFAKYKEYPDKLNEIHDRRHLLVHRLGKVDAQYKRNYSYDKDRVQIDHEDILTAFNIIYSFAVQLSQDLVNLLEEKAKKANVETRNKALISIEIINDISKGIISKDFCFVIEENVIMLSDLIESYNHANNHTEIIVRGEPAEIRGYLKILKQHEKRGNLNYSIQNVAGHQAFGRHPEKCDLPIEVITEIARSLPQKPWPKGIHKRIAQYYNTSNTQITGAIDMIEANEHLSSLIGTDPKFS